MEQHYRLVLGFCFLLFSEHLQAVPLFYGLEIKELKRLQCTDTTPISPTNVQTHCRAAALQIFEQGLINADKTCSEDTEERIHHTLSILQEWIRIGQLQQNNQTTPENCTWDERKPFPEFVKYFEIFIQSFTSAELN